MLTLYKKTELELLVEKIYKEKEILTPSDLSIKNISETFNFYIKYLEKVPCRALWDEEDTMIFLDSSLSEKEQRAIFFHELCHPIRHIGSQENMKCKLFMELQETQANQFQLYAAMPAYMLNSIELPNNEFYALKAIEEIFNIPYSFATKRMEQIKQRALRKKIDMVLLERGKKKSSESLPRWSEETEKILNQLDRQIQKKKEVILNG